MLSFEKYRRQMIDVTITLLPLLAMAWYYYGPRVLILAAISVLSAVAADYICLLMQGKRWFDLCLDASRFRPVLAGGFWGSFCGCSGPAPLRRVL